MRFPAIVSLALVLFGTRVWAAETHTITPALLGQLVYACAPAFDPKTQTAVIAVESSGDAWALHDNNNDRSYRPRSYPAAVALADSIIAIDRRRYGSRDAGLDVGVAQINSRNFPALGVTAAMMLHPCANLRVSSSMLARAYAWEYAKLSGFQEPQRTALATRAALSMYNSGHARGDEVYVQKVALALSSMLVQRALPPALDAQSALFYGASPRVNASIATARARKPVSSSAFAASGPRYHVHGTSSLFAHEDPLADAGDTKAQSSAPSSFPTESPSPGPRAP